jgi:hypothetical protein
MRSLLIPLLAAFSLLLLGACATTANTSSAPQAGASPTTQMVTVQATDASSSSRPASPSKRVNRCN